MKAFVITAALLLLMLPGCAYRFGACSLYRPDIQTVHVPIMPSGSFRRNLSEQLTEAVVKELETDSPYKVVGSAAADSVLEVRIESDAKRVVGENQYDEGRNLETSLQVRMTWRDRRGNLITQSTMPLAEADISILQSAPLIAEVGQSFASQEQRVIQRLATQIVSQMEAGW